MYSTVQYSTYFTRNKIVYSFIVYISLSKQTDIKYHVLTIITFGNAVHLHELNGAERDAGHDEVQIGARRTQTSQYYIYSMYSREYSYSYSRTFALYCTVKYSS